MADTTLLTWETGIAVKQVKDWIAAADRMHIAEFICERFTERYFAPVQPTSNGFFVMAVSCLVVEALESFRQGWPTTEAKGDKTFGNFFEQHAGLHQLRQCAPQFYKHVRCGILHQGETTGGWTLTRKNSEPLLSGKKINATKFHSELKNCLHEYVAELQRATMTAEVWVNCLKKLYSIIRNCD